MKYIVEDQVFEDLQEAKAFEKKLNLEKIKSTQKYKIGDFVYRLNDKGQIEKSYIINSCVRFGKIYYALYNAKTESPEDKLYSSPLELCKHLYDTIIIL